MKKTVLYGLTTIVFAALMVSGCSKMNKAQKGVLIGAGAGGAVGAGVGKAAGNTALGAIIGAAVGGATGGIIGREMDKQADEIENIPGAEVKRVGEGINVTFESGVLFAVNESTITPSAQAKIKDLAAVLNKYPETYILIEGHTDNSGSDAYNMTLSKQRATAVADYLKGQQIQSQRLKTAWYGESQPKASNDTESGKTENRRVEFAIYANEKMVEQAKKEAAN
jgi:outer membrane protein OmpA-like peptidoglycan-associated protein